MAERGPVAAGSGGLALGSGAHYLGAMPFPRPASPRVLWADLRAFTAARGRYQWVSMGLAILMPVAILFLFVLDSAALKPSPRITYIDSWSAARDDDAIRSAQMERARAKAVRDEEIRQRWKQLGDRTGVNP